MKITLSNYKAFKEKREFDLRKINLFVGANNAGKSTFADFVKTMQLNIKNPNKGVFTDLSESGTDFPIHSIKRFAKRSNDKFERKLDFNSLLNDCNLKSPLIISIEMIFGSLTPLHVDLEIIARKHLELYLKDDEDSDILGQVSSVKLRMGDKVILSQIGSRISINFSVAGDYFHSIEKDAYVCEDEFYHICLTSFKNKYKPDQIRKIDQVTFNSNVILGTYDLHDEKINNINSIEIKEIFFLFRNIINHMIYKAFNQFDIIENSNLISEIVIPTKYSENSINMVLKNYFNMEIKREYLIDPYGNKFVNKIYYSNGNNFHLHSQVGDGVKYLLGIINECSDIFIEEFSQDNIILLSEPERALHPDWQIKFMNYIVDQVAYHDYILETHSLTIVRAIQLAVAEGRISKNDIAIYDFYTNAEGEKSMDLIELDDNGQLAHPFFSGFASINSEMEVKLWELSQRKFRNN